MEIFCWSSSVSGEEEIPPSSCILMLCILIDMEYKNQSAFNALGIAGQWDSAMGNDQDENKERKKIS